MLRHERAAKSFPHKLKQISISAQIFKNASHTSGLRGAHSSKEAHRRAYLGPVHDLSVHPSGPVSVRMQSSSMADYFHPSKCEKKVG